MKQKHFLKQLSNKHGRSYDGKNELLDEDGSYRRESGFIESSCSNNIQNESQVILVYIVIAITQFSLYKI